MTARVSFVEWLRGRVPPERWESLWWAAPAAAALLLPLGYPLLYAIGYAGWRGVGRATQGLMLFSVACGFVVGALVLWSCGEAGLGQPALGRARWTAWLALVLPTLALLTFAALANLL
jgi:hypothetical protein